MALSWNEIRSRAISFQNEWQGEKRERAEKDSFYNDFFNVFGISRRRVASFEEAVKKVNNKQGFIDVFWKGQILIEHKSHGRDLDKAKEQALDYFPGLKEAELPKYIMVCDFESFELLNLETKEEYKFQLKDFYKNIELFGFIAGYTKKEYKDLEPVNIEASEKMGKLHDALQDSGYDEHDLEQFLVRLLFCLFADDTGIFEKNILTQFVEEKTAEDGSDTGMKLTRLFQVLNTPVEKRQKNLDESYQQFPYINGGLFAGSINIPDFNSAMREALLECCYFDWTPISPAIFGSLFQSVADQNKRRELGEHYTSEKNIMKTISPLFLDDLKAEFEKCLANKNEIKKRLHAFHKKLSKLKFFDPACGCGNFLIVAYREIRKIETEILKLLFDENSPQLDAGDLSQIDVDNFYGIEIDEFPAKIAGTAMWLMDHIMNIELSNALGGWYPRIPLKKEANIVHGNSLTIDWQDVIAKDECSYILGNPPFVGQTMQNLKQKQEMNLIFKKIKSSGKLDYVCAWFKKSADYIQDTKIKCALVSTNSITQGEQVGILWNNLLENNIKIHFAHRTFAWNNEAKGKAQVHCVIIGFGAFDIDKKRLFDYEDIRGEGHENIVDNINPYLTSKEDLIILPRRQSICDIPEMNFGSMPRDDGNLIFTDEEYYEFIEKEPLSKKYILKYTGAREFLNGYNRWCLWLIDCPPNELRNMPLVMDRIKKVKEFREKSKAASTREFSKTPSIFCQLAQPKEYYILVPRMNIEKRPYILADFKEPSFIANDQVMTIAGASLYHFGVITSIMHHTWMRYTAGRLKSDYRYSKDIVYNNFPWPKNMTTEKEKKIEELAQNILDIRASFKDCSLADLYDPNTMPTELAKAHNRLDKEVDKIYRSKPFVNEKERIEFLFDLYEEYTQPLIEGKLYGRGK